MTTGQQLVDLAKTQIGKPYVFAAEVQPGKTLSAKAWDCSELTSVVCNELGISLPDGAYNQWVATKGSRISEAEALRTPGCLGFAGDRTGSGRNAITHVVFTRGDGHNTVEARNRAKGTGSWPAAGRGLHSWSKIPGVNYGLLVPNPVVIDGAAIRRWVAGNLRNSLGEQPALPVGPDYSLRHVLAQNVLNFLSNANIHVDGIYGEQTATAVVNFQKFLSIPLSAPPVPGTSDFPGAIGDVTRFVMCVALDRIRDGLA